MITAFKCEDTRLLFAGKRVKRFANIESAAIRKLQQLHATTRLDTLKIPPGNRLEALKGERAGQYSLRINEQWRVCFRFDGGNAWDVEIVDYH